MDLVVRVPRPNEWSNAIWTPSGLPKALNDVGIDQKLNEQLPLNLEFRDENDRIVKLGDYFSRKPVVLSLVFYECRMLCSKANLHGIFMESSTRPGTFDLE